MLFIEWWCKKQYIVMLFLFFEILPKKSPKAEKRGKSSHKQQR